MKNKFHLITSCIAALACFVPVAAFAAPKTSPSPSPSPHASPAAKATTSPAAKSTTTTARAVPFHGMISTVDQTAKTFSIAGKEKTRVFKVTDSTVLTKAGAPATMKDVVAKEEVRGSYVKGADGSLEAKTVKLGPATDAEKAETKPSKKKEKSDTAPSASPSASPAASPKL
jgi:hypothetical protein